MTLSSLAVACAALLVAVLIAVVYRRSLSNVLARPSQQTPEKRKEGEEPERAAGEWTPVPFEFPRVEPWPDFDVNKTPPLPYRPFRWTPYHVTMGLRRMKWPEWIELDCRFAEYHAIKAQRVKERGEKAVRILPARPGVPGGAAAALESVHELSEFLSRRYPTVFRVTRDPYLEGDYGWYKEGQIRTIEILPLGVMYDLTKENPVEVAGLLVQDDVIIMVEGSDSRYYFQAGSVCVPGSWRPDEKFGKPLEEIHITGDVPQYESKLQLSMGRFFRKLVVDKPVQRNNYGFQLGGELAWASRGVGPEDQPRDVPSTGGFKGFAPREPAQDASEVWFRTERQTLRRLPRSGGLLFIARTYLEPVVKLAEEPGVPGRMAAAIRSWPDDVAAYKGKRLYADAVLRHLDEAHAKQQASGVVSPDDRTNNYPF